MRFLAVRSSPQVSSYTANLASFFTAESYAVVGPQDMTALRSATACLAEHSNDDAHLARHAVEWGVGELMSGLITSTMPEYPRRGSNPCRVL